MQDVCLTVVRFALSSWVGAAALFVVAGIREVRHPGFDTEIQNQLVLLRFPAYYAFGFPLVCLALLCTAGFRTSERLGRIRKWILRALIGVALALMIGDYVWIFGPLSDMMQPAKQARPAVFVNYHEASKWINAASITICFVAALVACWPVRRSKA